ncbi:hypothetical protein LXL04_015886 [Taraxacum kok-saghyz]
MSSSRLPSVISSKKPESRKKTIEIVIVETSEDDKEEVEVVERRSKKKNNADRIKNVNVQNSPVPRSKKKQVDVEEEEEEEEEEVDVKERRSKKKHDAGLKRKNPVVEEEEVEVQESVKLKNTRSSPKKAKDNKVVEEGSKAKISISEKKVVVEIEKPSRKKRQLLDEEDDDFVDVPGVSRIQKGKGKEVKKEVGAKDCVREMRFGTLLQSKLMDVPMKMCYYVLERLDVEKVKVVVENGMLNVSAQSVHDMLGLPLGGMSFKDMALVDEGDEESCMFEWKAQFENIKDLRLKQLKNDILLTRAGDFNFRINFLVIFINTFCESTSMGKCNLNALYHIKKDTDISSINWCQYIVDCLVRTKGAYKPDKESVREDYEMVDGGFQFGEINGKFVEEFVDISDDDEEDQDYEEDVDEEDGPAALVVDNDEERILFRKPHLRN